MIKICSLNKNIHLINDKSLFVAGERSVLARIGSLDELQLSYDELINKNNLTDIYFLSVDVDKLFNDFKSMFKIISAAGGIVVNKKGECLFIFRNGKWDLPKGKIEKNESIEEAAVREVEEECGIQDVSIVRELKPTYHTYFLEEKPVLKPTYWFEMKCKDVSTLIPQQEEGITDVRWITPSDFKMVRKNTYESIKEVISMLS